MLIQEFGIVSPLRLINDGSGLFGLFGSYLPFKTQVHGYSS